MQTCHNRYVNPSKIYAYGKFKPLPVWSSVLTIRGKFVSMPNDLFLDIKLLQHSKMEGGFSLENG